MELEEKLIVASLLRTGMDEIDELLRRIEDKRDCGTPLIIIDILRFNEKDKSDNVLLRERKTLSREIEHCIRSHRIRLETLSEMLFSDDGEIEKTMGENSGEYE